MDKLVADFKHFLENQSGFVVDLEVGDNSGLPKLIANYDSDDLEVFAESNNGSLWAIWKYKNTFPVVLISSESTPFDIVAKDFETFLALLHYGTGLMYQCLTFIDFAKRMGQTEKQALKRFDKKYLAKELQRFQADYPDYKALYNFLEEEGINAIEDPIQTFLSTAELRAAFGNWKEKFN